MAANAEVPPVARKTRKHIGGDDAAAEGSAGRSRECLLFLEHERDERKIPVRS